VKTQQCYCSIIVRGGGEKSTVRTIAEWLASLGLSEYAQRFAGNYIDASVLPDLTDQDLTDLGVPLGHRRKIRVPSRS
jgi:SAM (Sterile alpha motif) domain-containing protein